MIDPTARIEPGAAIGHNASIGPYCVVGSHAVIGDGCRLVAHVHVTGHTTIGPRTVLHPFASLGSPPQSVKYRGGPTRLLVGADGRNSVCRDAAHIPAAMQHDGQAAIATSFTHAAPHRGVSIELHRKGGSVTTVPLTDAFSQA